MVKEIQGAVLVIGSLYWEDETNAIDAEKGKLRKKWRLDELDMTKKLPVKCPIRYGRKSGTRRNTYTMLFSNSVPLQGKAFLIPFQNPVSIEDNFKLVHEQARYLAFAEGIRTQEEFNTHKNWGMVALKILPGFKKREPEIAQQLERWWSDLHTGLIQQNNYRINGSEDPSITGDGFLNFDFEILGNSDREIDYVFATPVVPGASEYPSAWEITEAIKKSNPHYSTYFTQNYSNQINTFQDEDIRLRLEPADRPEQVGHHDLQLEDYKKNLEGYYQFQHDIIRELGSSVFIPSKEAVCFQILKTFNYPFQKPGVNSDEIEIGCQQLIERIGKHFELFPDGEMKTIYDKFLFHAIGVEKLPGLEKDRIETMVKDDLRKRRVLIDRYEQEDFIKDFKADHVTPRNQDESTLHDFYMRNLNEEQIILNYLLDELENRAIYNCKMKLFGTTEYFDWYYDRPYTTAIPGSEDYFDHTLIDLCGNKIRNVDINKRRTLEKIYKEDKREFYSQLAADFGPDHVFHEIKFFLDYLPAVSQQRKPIFEELILLFQEKKWFGFYALGLTQIEGLFSEMAITMDPKRRKPSLPDKVEMERPAYEFAHKQFDYYQYHIPLLRNKFLHFGLDEDIELKCYDLLYDLRHLLEVYIDLKSPLMEINKIMKKRKQDDFHEVSGFNYFFDLLDDIKKQGQNSKVEQDVESFEKDFLSQHTDIEHSITELGELLPKTIKHWYEIIAVFTELNTSKLDLEALTLHQVNKNSADYVERIRPVYKAHKDIFETLKRYYDFLRRAVTYLPSLAPEVKKFVEKLLNDHKSDFNKLTLVLNNLTSK